MCTYKKSVWLNSNSSPSTGSVVVFHGKTQWKKDTETRTFLEVADCYYKVRLHKIESEPMEDFIAKLKKLETLTHDFRLFLENEKQKNLK